MRASLSVPEASWATTLCSRPMQRCSRLRWRSFLAFPSWREKSEPDNRAHERREEDKTRDACWLIEKRHACERRACSAESGAIVLSPAVGRLEDSNRSKAWERTLHAIPNPERDVLCCRVLKAGDFVQAIMIELL